MINATFSFAHYVKANSFVLLHSALGIRYQQKHRSMSREKTELDLMMQQEAPSSHPAEKESFVVHTVQSLLLANKGNWRQKLIE